MMSPAPVNMNNDQGRRDDEENFNISENLPPVILAGSSSEGEGEEDEMVGNMGYQLLPQDLGHEMVSYPEQNIDDIDDPESTDSLEQELDERVEEIMKGGDVDEASNSMLLESNFNSAQKAELAELWKFPRQNSADKQPMDDEHANTIRSVMSRITLPSHNVPDWANVIPETEWKAQLIARLHGTTPCTTSRRVVEQTVQDTTDSQSTRTADDISDCSQR